MAEMMIGWTSVDQEAKAYAIAQDLLQKRLAVCVQVEGPVKSFYIWEDKPQEAKEWRLMVKFLDHAAAALNLYWRERHPYTTPEWVCVQASFVEEEYLRWAHKVSLE